MAKVGLQLYTIKDETAKDFFGTIRTVGRMGYDGVEFAGYFGAAAKDLKKVLAESGLKAAGSILTLEEFEKDLAGVLAYGKEVGCPAMLVPGIWGDNVSTADGVRRSADRMNRIAAACKKLGMKFLFHIHGTEFADLGGRTPMDILLERCDPALVNFEADVYWIEHAGVDAVQFLKQHGKRCPYIHCKDFKDRTTKRDVEVGAGAIDMRGVVRQARRDGAEWFIVEQEAFDMPPMESAVISLRNLRRLVTER